MEEFLAYLLTVAGGGAGVWAAIHYADNLSPIPPEAKFWLAVVLSWLIPSLAYFIQIKFGYATFSAQGVFMVAGTAYMISQGIHRTGQLLKK